MLKKRKVYKESGFKFGMVGKKSVMFWSVLVLLASVFLINFVSAQSLGSKIFDPVKDMFATWNEGNLSVNIAKYVFWAIITLLVFTLLEFIPPFSNSTNKAMPWIRFILGVLIAFLSMAYLTPSDIYTALASYGAMGIVLSAVVPFIIIMFFTMQLSKAEDDSGHMIGNIVWVAFIVFLVYKVISGVFFCTAGGTGADAVKCIAVMEAIIYLAVIVFAIWYVWKGGYILMNMATKSRIKSMAQNMDEGKRTTLLAEAARLDKQAEAMMGTPGASKESVKKLHDRAEEMRQVAGE